MSPGHDSGRASPFRGGRQSLGEAFDAVAGFAEGFARKLAAC